MTPDRCGTGRRLSDLPEGDRAAVLDFGRFLRRELAYDQDRHRYVDPTLADGDRIVMAGSARTHESAKEQQ